MKLDSVGSRLKIGILALFGIWKLVLEISSRGGLTPVILCMKCRNKRLRDAVY